MNTGQMKMNYNKFGTFSTSQFVWGQDIIKHVFKLTNIKQV